MRTTFEEEEEAEATSEGDITINDHKITTEVITETTITETITATATETMEGINKDIMEISHMTDKITDRTNNMGIKEDTKVNDHNFKMDKDNFTMDKDMEDELVLVLKKVPGSRAGLEVRMSGE
jgi:hypothetical protein